VRIFSPVNPAPTGQPQTVPIRLASGQTQPATTPIITFDPTTGIVPAIQELLEPIFNEPPTKTGQCPTDPATKCRYDNKDIAGKCDSIQTLLDKNLDITYQGEINLPPCKPPETAQIFNANAQGLPGIDEKLNAVFSALESIWSKVRCEDDNECLLVVPEWWQVKAGANRPQLLLIYADKLSDGTWGRQRREFVIPHFNVALRNALKSILPTVRKGSYQGIYTLKDNSKIMMYCINKTEVTRILREFDRLVLPNQRTKNFKTGEISYTSNFQKITLYPYEARYFSRGLEALTPDWKEKLY
jgi:hypothetical protein